MKNTARFLPLALLTGACLAAEPNAAALAQKFRAAGQPVRAQADGALFLEAEEFAPAAGWKAGNWGENYYAATLANTFLSRKAFLGAPEQGEGAASITAQVDAAGRYLVLARYEAVYRFQTQFRIQIEQGGKVVFDRLYGARENPKIWAFGERVKPEVAWVWGAVENIVWEGHDAAVELQPGAARVTLLAGKQPHPAAKRNVDLVLLTRDVEGVQHRIAKENYLPLDGLLTQAGDVYFRLHNAGQTAATLHVGNGTEHSPYWVHLRQWQPKTITAEPGKPSDWVEVGSLLDSLNDGQWALSLKTAAGAAVNCTLEVGAADSAGNIQKIRELPLTGAHVVLAYDANTRYTRRIRPQEEVLYDLLAYLKARPLAGKPPQRTLVYADVFDRKGNPKYDAAVEEFRSMFNILPANLDLPGDAAFPRGYIDVRGQTPAQLENRCQEYVAKGLADKIAVVSLGDEIGLAAPPAGDHAGFRAFLQSIGVKPGDVDPAAGDDWEKVQYQPQTDANANPRMHYYAARYKHHYGIQQQKALTDVLRKYLPKAGIGANYSPHHGTPYLGEVHQWVTLFRQGGMTMPWGEDWIFQLPVGSQQMNFICLDMFRAGVRHQPQAKILYYVMPHWPGNTPESWRRQFFGDLGHGMQIVNLFEFRPVQAAYTENHCSLPEMYAQVRLSLHELAVFEDIIQAGRPAPGLAALWFSETGDIWHDNGGAFGAAKRTLYTAILHQQLPLDIVIEEDALADDLKNYRVLYLADRHVSQAASRKIAEWVHAGGRLLATAGAGMFDEFNQPNAVLRNLMGVELAGIDAPPEAVVHFTKQDLPFSAPLDTVTWKIADETYTLDVISVRARLQAQGGDVLATFRDGSPAIVKRQAGQGSVLCCGFLPGLAYYRPAIPQKPCDRNSASDSMAHFLPTEFHAGAARLIGLPAEDIARPVECSQRLVEAKAVRSPSGMAVTLVNWTPVPAKNLTVTLRGSVPAQQVTLASGKPLRVQKRDGELVLQLDLDVADAIVLR